MATLAEIAALPEDTRWGDFVAKVRASCVKKAADIIASTTPGQGAKDWAESALNAPAAVANQIVFAVIGANTGATVDQIFNANDNTINTNVSDAVNALYGV